MYAPVAIHLSNRDKRKPAGAVKTPSVGIFFEPRRVASETVLRGIRNYLREQSVSWNFYWSVLGEIPPGKLEIGIKLDGIIFNPQSEDFERARKLVRAAEIPVVDITGSGDTVFPSVVPDDYAVGKTVAEHFLARGFEHFGYSGIGNLLFSATRGRGFASTVRAAGFDADIFYNPHEDWTNMNAPEQLAPLDRWLAALPRPVAIMAMTDIRSRHVLASCRRLGLRVPEDVAICGVDDQAICELHTPSLSSVPLNILRTGYLAADMLNRLMHGEPRPEAPLCVPPQPVIVRESSDSYAPADSEVQAALHFIQLRSNRPMHVEQVVDAVLISRTSLEHRFREQLGRTIQNEIWRAHVARAKRLLGETRDDLRSVALASGLRSPQRLSQIFRQQTGMTPSAYRQKHGR